MERTVRNITFTLVAVLLAVQGYLFYKEYDGVAYASGGEQMSETTWLYATDEITIRTAGVLPQDFQIWKNGERLILQPDDSGAYIFTVKQHDLVELTGTDGNGALAEIQVTLRHGVFQESYYADVFDYTGGRVTVGWFVEK